MAVWISRLDFGAHPVVGYFIIGFTRSGFKVRVRIMIRVRVTVALSTKE